MQMSDRNNLLVVVQQELAVTVAATIKEIEDSNHIKLTADEIQDALKAVMLASKTH